MDFGLKIEKYKLIIIIVFVCIAWASISETSEMSDLFHKSALSQFKESESVSINDSST